MVSGSCPNNFDVAGTDVRPNADTRDPSIVCRSLEAFKGCLTLKRADEFKVRADAGTEYRNTANISGDVRSQ
jgi:hypothetical protein